MSVTRRLALYCGIAILATACSEKAPKPWSKAEMKALSDKFSHIAEAYAVVDVCMPMIDGDPDTKRAVIAKIEVRRYSQISSIDTKAEVAKFLAYHRRTGGTDAQAAELEWVYQDSYRTAAQGLKSIENCAETVTDYANTILQTRVEPGA